MKIGLTNFVLRQFDEKFKGTKITSIEPDKFLELVQSEAKLLDYEHENLLDGEIALSTSTSVKLTEGYIDFCKLLFVDNFTDAKTGTMPITISNVQYLQSDYKKRRPTEKAVLTRYFNLPSNVKHLVPKAECLMVILYSKDQIDSEAQEEYEKNGGEKPVPFEADYGIVSINGQMVYTEEPMSPITMMRNAIAGEGGSGVALDDKAYEKSVEFWERNALVI